MGNSEKILSSKNDVKTFYQSKSSPFEDYKQRKRIRTTKKAVIYSFLIAVVIWAWYGTEFTMLSFITGIGNIVNFIAFDMSPPDFSVLGTLIIPVMETIYMSIVGVVISIFFSIIFGYLAATTTSVHPVVAHIFTSIISFLRSIPAIVLAMFLVGSFGLGSFAGAIALGISGIGILGKSYKEILEEIDMRQVEALKATGADWLQIAGQAIWPQFKPGFVSWSFYKMDLNIREAAILGMIGAGGIGYSLQLSINLFNYEQAATAILMIFLLIVIVEYITLKLRRHML
ncbi:phosphonate ABC transporter, permease protein PhnE [Oceanobacillus damuensis]|uniref:phosphonate ABC transporter, permease protein PhnE n=1 Tax=Oceanobacillus damuensis TaxID=937928 RepID=UPI000831777B|nr:phosphonate ABC transporter, permease protein PhnE [Oceanobacillus damuensis]